MDLNTLLNQAKTATGCQSDYCLSKQTGISEANLSFYRKGKRTPDAYAATRLALALGRDPLELIAEIEAEAARSSSQRDWWRGFLSSLARSTGKIVAVLASCGGLWLGGGHPPQVAAAETHNGRLRYIP